MAPTADELQIGAKAYESVRWYEKYGARNLKKLPWIFGCSFVAAMAAVEFLPSGDHRSTPLVFIFTLPAFMSVAAVQSFRLKQQYAANQLLLQLLKEKYGDSLPWIQDEKALAASRALEEAIKRDPASGSA